MPAPIHLYGRPGCGLCDETRSALVPLLEARRTAGLTAPEVVERDITTDPAWERDFHLVIPVLEIGAERLLVATSPSKIRDFLAAALDGADPVVDARVSC